MFLIEGNDVASNIKWVMSSNSLVIMPRVKFETWFMEGELKPNVHYAEIKDNYENLEELLEFFIKHPNDAKEISTMHTNMLSSFLIKSVNFLSHFY